MNKQAHVTTASNDAPALDDSVARLVAEAFKSKPTRMREALNCNDVTRLHLAEVRRAICQILSHVEEIVDGEWDAAGIAELAKSVDEEALYAIRTLNDAELELGHADEHLLKGSDESGAE